MFERTPHPLGRAVFDSTGCRNVHQLTEAMQTEAASNESLEPWRLWADRATVVGGYVGGEISRIHISTHSPWVRGSSCVSQA